ncbi:hypothetical protein N0V88_001056 [Collariella sp. IMI 366227]|nr:hypothetical protein N0V88_001056 [Collariella sp. IMI 366227]
MPPAVFRSAPPASANQDQELPPEFSDIKAVLDEKVPPGKFINVIGLVKDCQLPIPTIKQVLCNIFRPEADMPEVEGGDIVVLTSVKVQRYRSDPMSLITNRATSIRVYQHSKIPRPPKSAQVALKTGSSRQQDKYAPTAQDHLYVSYIYHKIDKDSIPGQLEFQERAVRSLNVKNKFSLLKDVQEGKFYDLIVQVARDPFGFDMVTLYVSDYTENSNFHPQIWQGLADTGDPYGYTSGNAEIPKKEWAGPYGKMTIQVTCFEPHSTIIRDEVTAGQWVFLRNVQIRHGRDGQYLEGFLREERDAPSTKINVQVLEATNRDTIDPRLKDAIRRCRDYNDKKKKQIKEIKAAQTAGLKRKASTNSEQDRPLNAKERRNQKRAQKQETPEDAVTEQLRLGLNDQVTCEVHKAPFTTIEPILQLAQYERSSNVVHTLPFVCAKYQSRVRVVDFFPSSLEDFASSRKQTQYDMLSDNEDHSDGQSSSDDDRNTRRIWEWRFALQLEDAAAAETNTKRYSTNPPRIWVFVDNFEAQSLTNLDAADLRRDTRTLGQLRERMFKLWGDLEEVKSRATAARKQVEEQKEKGKKPRHGEKTVARLEKPALESSDAEDEGGQQGGENGAGGYLIRIWGIEKSINNGM